MDELAAFQVHCEQCNIQYRPKIQGGIPIIVCPNCHGNEKQTILQG